MGMEDGLDAKFVADDGGSALDAFDQPREAGVVKIGGKDLFAGLAVEVGVVDESHVRRVDGGE